MDDDVVLVPMVVCPVCGQAVQVDARRVHHDRHVSEGSMARKRDAATGEYVYWHQASLFREVDDDA